MFIETDLFLIAHKFPGEASNKMLTNVTKKMNIQQFIEVTCFIIHVYSNCVGEKAYA